MVRTVLFGAIVVVFGAIGARSAPKPMLPTGQGDSAGISRDNPLAGSIAAPDPGPALAGMYECSGVNPDGTSYEGVVEIAKLEDTYRVLWTLSDNTAVMGVGIFSGGVFAVSYFGGAPAIVVYTIDGSRLVGEWTMGGREGAVYSKTLTRVSSQPRQRRPAGSDPASTVRRIVRWTAIWPLARILDSSDYPFQIPS
ncbi:MAG: hypothetical protein HY657_14400 [Acidobacteria bacterium]|nr:hypothetical protein [Acidobacteriota bacterium]